MPHRPLHLAAQAAAYLEPGEVVRTTACRCDGPAAARALLGAGGGVVAALALLAWGTAAAAGSDLSALALPVLLVGLAIIGVALRDARADARVRAGGPHPDHFVLTDRRLLVPMGGGQLSIPLTSIATLAARPDGGACSVHGHGAEGVTLVFATDAEGLAFVTALRDAIAAAQAPVAPPAPAAPSAATSTGPGGARRQTRCAGPRADSIARGTLRLL